MCRIVLWCLLLVVANPALARERNLEPIPDTARIRIAGPSPISGSGPVALGDLPAGESTLVVSARGFAAARTRLFRDAQGRIEFRNWAGPSAFAQPPGFVHLRRGESRGFLHLGAWVGSGLVLLVSQQSLREARDRLELAREEFAASGSADAVNASLALGAARDEEFDRVNVRDLWAVYLAAAWVGAGIEAWWMTPRPSLGTDAEGDLTIASDPSSGWKTALSSLLVPGAGQRSLGHDRRGNALASAVLLAAAGAIVTQDLFLDARRERTHAARVLALATDAEDVASARTALQDAESEEDRLSTVRYAALTATIALHTWNVVDAFVLGRRAPEVRVAGGPRLAPTLDGVRLSFTWNFDLR